MVTCRSKNYIYEKYGIIGKKADRNKKSSENSANAEKFIHHYS